MNSEGIAENSATDLSAFQAYIVCDNSPNSGETFRTSWIAYLGAQSG